MNVNDTSLGLGEKQDENYIKFVDTLTSDPSKDFKSYINRLTELQNQGCDIARLDTATSGMSSESGECVEIVKKMKFQGKPWNEDTRYHLKRELGDVIFYWIIACIATGYSPEEIINENISKLESRYPSGKFNIQHSENRKPGDL